MSSNSKRSYEDDDDVQQTRKKPKADLDSLKSLLDLSGLQTDEKIQARFREIADELLFNRHLCLKHNDVVTKYELVEIEFYLKNDVHRDPFCHAAEDQRRSCQWYFHRAPTRQAEGGGTLPPSVETEPKLTGFRGGTRKGLDLTFGSPYIIDASTSSNCRGGVLLRSMRRAKDDHLISGPSLLVDEILKTFQADSISKLVADIWQASFNALEEDVGPRASTMYLAPRNPGSLPEVMYTSPRVGLDLSHPSATATCSDPRVSFVGKQYRYFRHPRLLTKNGRLQTFVGLVIQHQSEKKSANSLLSRLESVGGFKSTTAKSYLASFESSGPSRDISPFVGRQGKNVLSSGSTYLRMMGTLNNLALL